jgi:type I restriction enzyme S subunit
VSYIDDLINRLCPKGVPFKTLGDLGEFIRGNGLQKRDLTDTGFPAIHYGQIHTSYGTSTAETISFVTPEFAAKLRKAQPGDLVVATTSEDDEAVGKAVAWTGDTPVAVSGDAYIYHHKLEPRYVSYFFQSDQFRSQKKRSITGTKVRRVSGESLAKIKIPVPPVEVQREIVQLLDSFAALEAELESTLATEAEARRAQHAHYRSRVLAPREVSSYGESAVVLSDLVDFIKGKPPERLVSTDGTIALMTARFISTAGKSARWVKSEDVLTPARRGDIAMVMSDLPNGRALARCFYVGEDGKYTANQRVCLLRVRDGSVTEARYLYHFLDRNPQLLAFNNGQDQTHLKKGQILGIRVPVVPFDVQQHAVSTLDRLDTGNRDLVSALQAEQEARRKQYEYYRDRLLTFEEAIA